MKTFIEKQKHWQKLKQNSKKEEAEAFYWNNLFPVIYQQVKKHSTKYHKKYHCLISLVGFSPAPVILTIKILEPDFVLFLYTKDTQSKLDIIKEQTGLKLANLQHLQVSGSKSEDVFNKIKQFISEYQGKNIAVDITGGKKSMVGGAAIAGALTGCDIFYVDFSQYNEEQRQPMPGSEYLNFLSNPFEVFGDLEMEKGKRLFNEGDYYAASQIFLDLLEKIPHNEEAVLLYELSVMFKNWDEYNFPAANEACKKALKQIQRCQIYLHLLASLQEKEEILKKLISGDFFSIILNHYFTSLRMANRKRFDFATLLLYRTLEMVFATRLQQEYKFYVNEPDYSTLDHEKDFLNKYQQAGKTIYGNKFKQEPLPSILAFMNAYHILLALKDVMIADQNPKRVPGIAQLRNKCILIHGTHCIIEKQFQQIQQCFLPFLEYFVAEYFESAKLINFEAKFCFFGIHNTK